MRGRSGWMAAALAAACGLAWWLSPGEEVAPVVRASLAQAASQSGTTVDGRAQVELGGELRVDAALRRLFDYHLASYGEKEMNAIRLAVKQSLRESLTGRPLQQALALFERYLAYRQSLAGWRSAAGADLADRLTRVADARRQYFSAAEIEGLFGEEDAYDRFTAQRLRLLAAPGLSAAEKAARLQALEASLPEALRAARQAPLKPQRLAEAEAALRKSGGGEQEIYVLRSQMAGQAAADRLGQLDKEEERWRQRIDAYLAQRRQLQADAAIGDANRRQALAALEAASFNPQERLRLGAYLP